ncbi:hypothetical protein O181_036013 [Austropuccinia psidii MF-1]|uniref:Transcription factor IIIC putative zinc-finger domain-containing protein n=1 Tax=Austropuccinia psidii MF-1 TaxID=1389203 RepID=A0A9Q3H8T0_9BASI|nr:hypothetical protein [Austropuccinia psidii MF-1]
MDPSDSANQTENGQDQVDSDFIHASNLSPFPINNFSSCLDWSDDGQAFVITRFNIYILTPILGYSINPDHTNTSTQSLSALTPNHSQSSHTDLKSQNALNDSNKAAHKSSNQQIPLFNTIIEVEKQVGVNWGSHSNDMSIIGLPCDDRYWRAASWSPSGLSELGSSLIATLTTNYDVFIFVPDQNYLNGLWKMKQTMNLSEELLRVFFESYSSFVNLDESQVDVAPETDWSQSAQANFKRTRFTSCVLRAQATSIAWSPAYLNLYRQLHFTELEAFHDVDFSLLAIGHRRGDISLWRHTFNGNMELVFFNAICPNGQTVNVLRWSDWTLECLEDSMTPTKYQLSAYLAIATSKGVVYIIKVYRPFERAAFGVSPVNRIEIEIKGVYKDELNQSTISHLRWISSSGNLPPTLLFSRLGEVVLLKVPLQPHSDVDLAFTMQTVELPELRLFNDRFCWADCSSWAVCTGINATPADSPGVTWIVVTLANGLLYALKQLEPDFHCAHARLELDLEHSIQLSLDFRAKFRLIGASLPTPQNSRVTKQCVMKTYGSYVLSALEPAWFGRRTSFNDKSISFWNGCIMSWLYETDNPNKFRYKPENQQTLYFAMAYFNPAGKVQTAPQSRTMILLSILEEHIEILTGLLERPCPCIRTSPTMKLFNIFHALHALFSNPESYRSLIDLIVPYLNKLIHLLEVESLQDSAPSNNIISVAELMQITEQLAPHSISGLIGERSPSSTLSSSLIGELFDNEYLDRLRLKSNMCRFLLNKVDKVNFKEVRSELISIQVNISRLIHSEILRIITRFFHNHQSRLSDDEKEVSERYHYATRVINQYPEPTLEQLLEPDEVDHKLLDQDRLQNTYLGQSIESCPACQQQVTFDDLRLGVCELGHVWDRCSVTFQILATIKLRVCVGCGRKALRSSHQTEDSKTLENNHEGNATKNFMIEILLNCARCCLHCGCRWKYSS